MTEGVNTQEAAVPEKEKIAQQQLASEKSRENFARLEAAKDAEREARIRAEMEREMLRKEMDEIKQMLRPQEKDPLDEVEDYVDPARLKAAFARREATYKREAEEIARKTFAELRQQEDKQNYLQKLKGNYHDFDEVMTEANIASLETNDPVFLEAVLEIQDDYKRREKTYKYLKSKKQAPMEEKPSIKEKIEENLHNPFYIPSSVGTPASGHVDFDIKSSNARKQAYEKLKAAQRRPIGSGQAPNLR
jgi:hypothetical protein